VVTRVSGIDPEFITRSKREPRVAIKQPESIHVDREPKISMMHDAPYVKIVRCGGG
jgi:hypothetical protein